jgi:hypothetical protein
MLDKQSWTAYKGWTSGLWFGGGANNSSPYRIIVLRNVYKENFGPGLILWYGGYELDRAGSG